MTRLTLKCPLYFSLPRKEGNISFSLVVTKKLPILYSLFLSRQSPQETMYARSASRSVVSPLRSLSAFQVGSPRSFPRK